MGNLWKAVGFGLFGLASTTVPVTAGSLSVDPHFSDHLVLQRGRPVVLRGDGVPGSKVTVRFGDARAETTVDQDGRWRTVLPPTAAGDGALDVSDSTGGALRLNDVVLGDVFLCSGQSNMDLAVSDTAYPRRTVTEAEGMSVRLLKVRRTSSPRRETRIVAETPWAIADASSLPSFSAACWHMARTLAAADPKTPIGLVQASWGGASIEDWLDPNLLADVSSRRDDLDLLSRYAADPAAAAAEVVAATDAWAAAADPSAVSRRYAAEAFDDSTWPAVMLPGAWERSGVEGLAGFDGLMWFRRDLLLSWDQAERSAVLQLGRIDERDQVWVNGRNIGAGLTAAETRRYTIPPGLLKPGRNVIAVRVIDERGGGGLTSRPADLRLELSGAEEAPLAGLWRYQPGTARREWAAPPPFVPWAAPRGFGTMWNGMIAPLEGFPLKGIAWYQGETNTADADAYAGLLRVWAESWRRQFDDPALALVVAQLPGYGPRSASPTNGDWAKLREAQRRTAEADPRMGLAVLIDQGVAHDIHPAHKEVVGERIGNEMLRLAYGQPAPRAPSPVVARRTPAGIRVSFEHAGSGLVVYGSHDAAGFELCNAANVCRFVPARVEGDAVLLPADPQATEVRYGWQASPVINLYDDEELPAPPFSLVISDVG